MRTLFLVLAASLALSVHAEQAIKVYAAGSLKSAMNELAASYSNMKVVAEYGASGLLRDRIAKGARPEVFASADMGNPFSLERLGLAGPVKRFARNRMCALAAPGVQVDSDTLLERMLDPAIKLGTSTPKSDPSGDYAWQLFEKAEQVRPGAYTALSGKARKLVGGPDSPPPPKDRNVYGALIAEGKADILLAYCTGVREAKNENVALQVIEVPTALAVSADYGMVLVLDSREEAWYFVQFVLSPRGQSILMKHGFAPGEYK